MQKEKLLENIRQHPAGVSFNEIEKLLELYGLELRSKKGSHYTFKREGVASLITVPNKNPINPIYVINIVKIIDSLAGIQED